MLLRCGIERMMLIHTFRIFRLPLVLVFLLLPECVLGQEKKVEVMTYDEYIKLHHSYPYIVEIQFGKGALLYFGAQHTNDQNHPQMAQIEELWNKFRPKV